MPPNAKDMFMPPNAKDMFMPPNAKDIFIHSNIRGGTRGASQQPYLFPNAVRLIVVL
jgi:hypothetical protein